MKTLCVSLGINDYYEPGKLQNAVNDAKEIADVFHRLGYDVIHQVNCNMETCLNTLEEFEKRLANYDASIFYFAGHGFQVEGENYLASVDCQVANPHKYHCKTTCLTLSDILSVIGKHPNKVNIVIIDACRKSFDRGSSPTFTPIHAPKGTLIAFSTSPNDSAKDVGMEGHSIYTGALLKYIGREAISVEELFKKVRKTVYNLTSGGQTSWEHTSLTGDFYFNTGQLIHSKNIPYDQNVVNDSEFRTDGDSFSNLIGEIASSNWDRQNAAIDKILRISPNSLDKNQQFIFGRNIYQASGFAFSADNFFDDLPNRLKAYSKGGENHLLNGILFEIYFNSKGEFRRESIKSNSFGKVMKIRGNSLFDASFDFIEKLLEPHRQTLFWMPSKNAGMIDVDVIATSEVRKNGFGSSDTFEVITSAKAQSRELLPTLSRFGITGQDIDGLKDALAHILSAPKNLVNVNSGIPIKRLAFPKDESLDSGF